MALCEKCILKNSYQCWLTFMKPGHVGTSMRKNELVGCSRGIVPYGRKGVKNGESRVRIKGAKT